MLRILWCSSVRRTLRTVATVVAVVVFIATCANAANIALFSTGNGDTTCGHSDAHWNVSTNNGPAFILDSTCQNWFSGWAPNTSKSSWIGATTTNPTPPPPYTFSETFSMSGYILNTAVITGIWSIDDTGTLFINGIPIDTETRTFAGVSFTVPDADLIDGINTLSVAMTADDGMDDGARVEITQATADTPEPCTLVMFGGGVLAAFNGFRRKFEL